MVHDGAVLPAVAPKEKPRTADPSGYFINTKLLKQNLRGSEWLR